MTKRLTIVMTALVAVALLAGWHSISREDFKPFNVSREGHYLIDGTASVNVFKADNGLLNISYSVDGSKQQWTNGTIDPKKQWNLYVHNRNEVWLIADDDVTYMFHLEKSSGNYGLFNCHDPLVLNDFIFQRMPSKVADFLPERILNRISTARRQGKILKRDEHLMDSFASQPQ